MTEVVVQHAGQPISPRTRDRGLRELDLPGGHYGLVKEPAAVANLLLAVCG